MDSDFDKIRRGDFTLYIKSQFRNSDFGEAILAGFEELQRRYELKRVISSEYARIHKFVAEINGVPREIYLKQYLCGTFRALIKSFLFASRAMCDYEHSMMMTANGFNVAEVIAMGQWRGGLSRKGSFLATLAIENALPVSLFLRKPDEDAGQIRKDMRVLMRGIGRATGLMHAKGIIHGDLRLSNILLRWEGQTPKLFFLDNERTRKFKSLPDSLRLRNLVQVNMTQSDKLSITNRMRFFREYFAQTGTGKVEGKAIIKAVFKEVSRRLDRKKQRRKELKKSTLTKAGDMCVEGGDYRGVFRKGFCTDTECLFLWKESTPRLA